MNKKSIGWGVSDGRAGIQVQTTSLLDALGLESLPLYVQMRPPWRWLPPVLIPRTMGRWVYSADTIKALTDTLAPASKTSPRAIVTCGRQAALFGVFARRLIRKAGLETTVIQVQDSGLNPALFDFVVTPTHDKLRGPNVLTSQGGLNSLTPARLDAAAQELTPRLRPLPRPLVAVLIGGKSKVHDLTAQNLDDLLHALRQWHDQSGCGFLITPSRRTPHAFRDRIQRAFADLPHFYWDGEKPKDEGGTGAGGPNPYRGYLAVAQHIVVSADSVNMLTEAASTGKPVWIAPARGGSAKFDRLHHSLVTAGIARPLSPKLESWHYPPLREAARIAAQLHSRRAFRGV